MASILDKKALFARFFCEEEHFKDFVSGKIYLNSLSAFKKIDDGGVRGDRYEGALHMMQFKKIEIRPPASEQPILLSDSSGQIHFYQDDILANVLCFYMLMTDEDISPEVASFGNYSLLFKDFKGFKNRLKDKLQQTGRELEAAPVEYVDFKRYDGPLGFWRKSNLYAYQKEFRMFVPGGDDKPLIVDIGDISDLIYIGETQRLIELWADHRSKIIL